MERVLLHGGAVWDGSGQPSFPADVLVEGNRITPECAFVSPNSLLGFVPDDGSQ